MLEQAETKEIRGYAAYAGGLDRAKPFGTLGGQIPLPPNPRTFTGIQEIHEPDLPSKICICN
jgi:hypothetical protein